MLSPSALPMQLPYLAMDQSVTKRSTALKPLWQALLDERFDIFTHQFNELSHETRVEIVQVSWSSDFFRGQSLLHVACDSRDKTASDVVSLLLRTMADADIPNNQREALLWVQDMNCLTPLHYACRKQSTDIVRQLLYPPWPSEDGTCRVRPQTIPSTVTTTLLATSPTPDIMRLLLQHSRGNPLYGFSDFNAVFPSCRLPESSLEHAVPIVVLGEKKSGKSTIIKSLQIEGAWARLLYLFKNVSGAAQHKGGVIPTQAPEHSYLGKVVFFELSSNREFVREAILEIGHLVDAVFIIVINTKEEIDVMTEQMVIWADFIQQQTKKANSGTPLQPNVIIIGSHRDVLPLGRWAAPNERFLLAYRKAMAKAPLQNCNILSRYTMDFRKSTIEVHLIQSKLHRELERLRRHRPLLPSISYVLYSVISDLCGQTKEKAITLHELLQELTNASSGHHLLLPQDAGEVYEYCDSLKKLNILHVLKDNDSIKNSWIITDPLPMLEEIETLTNTNEVFSAYCNTPRPHEEMKKQNIISGQKMSQWSSYVMQRNGVMERDELERKFHSVTDPATTDTDLIIKVMKHFKYADEILLPQPPPKPDRPCFYIPHLLPRKLDYEKWHFNDPEYTYMGTWAMIPDKFLYFMPHHIHQLLLRISLSDVVPLHSGCGRTLGSFSWLDPSDGVQVLISDHNSQALVLNMRCFKGNEIKCLKQRSAIIMKIRSLIAQIDCDFTVSEIMVPCSRVECTKFRKSLPILNPLHHDLWHCKMEDIRNSIKEGKEGVLTHDSTNMVKVNDLLHFEPYSRLLKMPKELSTPLGDPASNDLELKHYFVIQLLQALGNNGKVDRRAHQLFLDIVGTMSSMLQCSDDPMAIGDDVYEKGLTYSQLRKHLDSICVIRYNELQ